MNISDYKPATRESFEQWLRELEYNRLYRQPKQKDFVLYTGYNSMIIFDLALQGVTMNSSVHYTFTTHKRTNNIWINIFNKSGLCKIKVRKGDFKFKLVCYYGTTEIGQANDLKSAVSLYSKYPEDIVA